MKHPSAAFSLLVVGLLLSYSWYWFPADIQGWIQNISSALTALFLLVVIGMLFGSAEVWGVVANRSEAFEFATEGQADRQLNRLSDELFDRYFPTVAPVEVEVA